MVYSRCFPLGKVEIIMQLILHMSGSWPESRDIRTLQFVSHSRQSRSETLGYTPENEHRYQNWCFGKCISFQEYIFGILKLIWTKSPETLASQKEQFSGVKSHVGYGYPLSFSGFYPFATRLWSMYLPERWLGNFGQKQTGYGKMKSRYNCFHWGC